KTKNGEERSVYLPMHLVVDFANQPPRVGVDPKLGGRQKEDVGVPFIDRRPERRLFRFTPSGFLRDMLKDATLMPTIKSSQPPMLKSPTRNFELLDRVATGGIAIIASTAANKSPKAAGCVNCGGIPG